MVKKKKRIRKRQNRHSFTLKENADTVTVRMTKWGRVVDEDTVGSFVEAYTWIDKKLSDNYDKSKSFFGERIKKKGLKIGDYISLMTLPSMFVKVTDIDIKGEFIEIENRKKISVSQVKEIVSANDFREI